MAPKIQSCHALAVVIEELLYINDRIYIMNLPWRMEEEIFGMVMLKFSTLLQVPSLLSRVLSLYALRNPKC